MSSGSNGSVPNGSLQAVKQEEKNGCPASIAVFVIPGLTRNPVLRHIMLLDAGSCPLNKLQNECHFRAGWSPVQKRLDSRLRENDGSIP
jgi:hypothetical protein